MYCREFKSGQLRWLGILLADLQRQLRYGVPTDLLPLIDIKGVSAVRLFPHSTPSWTAVCAL